MVIERLIIYNFRSYFGKKEFVFSKQLNLILGANGDGKTTFFEALNWVLTPDSSKSVGEKLPEDDTLVSAKMFSQLAIGETGKVLVSIELRNNAGSLRVVDRGFSVTKKDNGEMRIEGRYHKAFQRVGQIRKELFSVRDVFEKENAFPAIIKKYHIFKGEDELNIFNEKSALQALIDMFTEVKDLEPYKAFAKYAKERAEKKRVESNKKATQQETKQASLQADIVVLGKQLDDAEAKLTSAKKEHNEMLEKIEAIDSDYEIIGQVAELKKEIYGIEKEIERLSDKIDEKYSIKLLDEQWILLGFGGVLKEYNSKMQSLVYSKNNIETDYRRKQEEEYSAKKTEQAKSELEKIAWNKSDVDKMKHMLSSHRCTYCGTEAPEGSLAFDFIRQRINDVIELLTPKPYEKTLEIKPYFSGRNIEELYEIGTSLAHAGRDIDGIDSEINALRQRNDEIRKLIAEKKKEEESKRKNIEELYAKSTSGEDLKDYVTNFANVNRWHNKKEAAAREMDILLKKTIPDLKEQLAKKRDELKKIAKATGGNPLIFVQEFFRLVLDAVENTEAANYEEFLKRLANKANQFLALLNVDDFTGIIKIYLDYRGDLQQELQDKNGQLITNPNKSLLTTMHISILLAIAELTKENRDAEYPLIFDAPTSSFDEGKDKTFYECLSNYVKKQCIVVTKSYLHKNDENEFEIDRKALSRLDCKKYRIKKQTGFDKQDLSTIDTIVEEIKE